MEQEVVTGLVKQSMEKTMVRKFLDGEEQITREQKLAPSGNQVFQKQ